MIVSLRQVYGVGQPEEIYTYSTLRQYFKVTLDKVAGRLTQHKKLVILIDGLDHLTSESDAQSLSWLPDSWPKHVHVVLTTDTANGLSMRNLGNHINRIIRSQQLDGSVADECFFRIISLTPEELEAIVDTDLMRSSRTLSLGQRQVRACVPCFDVNCLVSMTPMTLCFLIGLLFSPPTFCHL